MSRPRDSQSTKAWTAMTTLAKQLPQLELKPLQRTADRLTKQAWFARRARATNEKYSVFFINGSACSDHNYCQLGTDRHTMLDLLHQMAHYMLPREVAWHGVEFARLMLDLVHHIGLDPTDTSPERRKADREALKGLWNANGVKWRLVTDEARANARARWYARDLAAMREELTGS